MLESTSHPLSWRPRSGSRLSLCPSATGELQTVPCIACAGPHAIAADNIGFSVGRTWGLKSSPTLRQIPSPPGGRLILGQYIFKKHGGKIVVRPFFCFLRVLAALLAEQQYRMATILCSSMGRRHGVAGLCSEYAPFSFAIRFIPSAAHLGSSHLPVLSRA